ncbi:MAG: type II toxin-antitoxin system Phd/YefM family antitoxin [Elusimicrobia bacterium]|nr:type II toxin-antitoxin system Phd/YefM family antitoxin [Elusimicrobiota bacterium]
MRLLSEPTAIAAISELRTHLALILAQLRQTPVALEKRNRTVAVMVDPKRFEAMEAALEQAADLLLAFEARRRERSSKKSRYPTLDEVERRFR